MAVPTTTLKPRAPPPRPQPLVKLPPHGETRNRGSTASTPFPAILGILAPVDSAGGVITRRLRVEGCRLLTITVTMGCLPAGLTTVLPG